MAVLRVVRKQEIVIRNLLVFSYAFFSLQGYIFYNELISKSCQLLCAGIGFIYLMRTTFFQSKRPFVIVVWALFFFVQLGSFLFYPKEVMSYRLGVVPTLNELKQVCMTILCFFPFYFWGQNGYLSDKFVRGLVLLFFVFGLLQFSFVEQKTLTTSLQDNITNNAAYTFVYLSIAFPLFFKNNLKWGLLLLGISTVLIMYGNKRGAIVCYVVLLMLFSYYYVKVHRSKIVSMFIIGVILLGMCVLGYNEYSSNVYLQERVIETMEGNDSGRSLIYTQLWKNWSQHSSISQQLFGRGMAQTINVAGNYAHNDWLELLINNGLLGTGLYLVFFLSVYSLIKKSKLIGYDRCVAYASVLVLFMISIFSMGYTGGYFCFLILGTMIGRNESINRQFKTKVLMKNYYEKSFVYN